MYVDKLMYIPTCKLTCRETQLFRTVWVPLKFLGTFLSQMRKRCAN